MTKVYTLESIGKSVDDLMESLKMVIRIMQERFDKIDERFEQIDRRFEQVDKRFEQIDIRFAQMDMRFKEIDGTLHELAYENRLTNSRFIDHEDRISDLEKAA